MRLTFLGATHEVTGSCFYLEVGEHKLLIDCGMEPVSYTHLYRKGRKREPPLPRIQKRSGEDS